MQTVAPSWDYKTRYLHQHGDDDNQSIVASIVAALNKETKAMPSIWNVTDFDKFERELAAERAGSRKPAARAPAARPAPVDPVAVARAEGAEKQRRRAAKIAKLCVEHGCPDLIAALAGGSVSDAKREINVAIWTRSFASARRRA